MPERSENLSDILLYPTRVEVRHVKEALARETGSLDVRTNFALVGSTLQPFGTEAEFRRIELHSCHLLAIARLLGTPVAQPLPLLTLSVVKKGISIHFKQRLNKKTASKQPPVRACNYLIQRC
jgi:hypothetical protein